MNYFKSIVLSLLIAFTAFHPAAYADCCGNMAEETLSCCNLQERHHPKENDAHAEDHTLQKTNCHTSPKPVNDGQTYFSCCQHLPYSSPDFTSSDNSRIQRIAQIDVFEQQVQIVNSFFLEPVTSAPRGLGSGSSGKTPAWIILRNFRC